MSGELVIGRTPEGLQVLRADRVVELSLELLGAVQQGNVTGAEYDETRRLTVRAVNGTWVYRITGPAGATSMWAALESSTGTPPLTPPAPQASGVFGAHTQHIRSGFKPQQPEPEIDWHDHAETRDAGDGRREFTGVREIRLRTTSKVLADAVAALVHQHAGLTGEQNDQGPGRPAVGDHDKGQENPT